MSSQGRSAGKDITVPSELRCQAQDSVRECIASADVQRRAGRGWVVPLAASTAVAAAACVPVAWPVLVAAGAGGGAALLGAAFSQVSGVGGNLLAEAVIRAWDRLRARRLADARQADLRDALAAELETGLAQGTPAAAALREQISGVLRGVDAVQVALAATIEESAGGLRDVLVRGLRALGQEFAEFGWIMDEINVQLAFIAEDVARAAATARDVADNQQQTLVELAMLRQEARNALGSRASRLDVAVPAGPSADEERAAALDAAAVPVSADCPYLGLAAFQPEDAGRFFGREQLTAELVTRAGELLARPGLLMVLGPSGSGKSSLLRAGLLPAVAAGALPVRGSWAWPRDLMTPGRRPLMELATRIASLAGVPAGALEADLRTDPIRITGAIRQAMLTHTRRQGNVPGLTPEPGRPLAGPGADQNAAAPDSEVVMAARSAATEPRLVLIVDQFEEVYSQCSDEQERRTFIQALCAAAGVPACGTGADGDPASTTVDAREAPALVVIGMRADFYARSAVYPELAPHLQDHQVLVGPLDEAGLRQAIEKPAAAAGLVADAALVEVLLADVGLTARADAATASTAEGPIAATTGRNSYAAGRLALLGYALEQTWRNRDGRRLTVAGYRATGGIDRAVAQAADNVYDRLDPAGQDALQRVLLRLVTFGDGTPDSRRRVDITELTAPEDSTQSSRTRAALADLIDARLITADTDTVEITHETLLTAWPRLRRWLTEDRAGLRIHRDLTGAARDWQRESRDPGRLFRGTRLAVTRDWAADHDEDLNPGERAFLAASQHDQLRATRRRRTAVVALAVLTAMSLAAAGIAVQQRGAAFTARNQAVSNQIAVVAGQLTATDPSLVAQLDVAANQYSPTPDSETRLLDLTTTTPMSSRLTVPASTIESVAFSPDGKILAAADDHGQAWLWNLADPTHPTRIGHLMTSPADILESLAFSPDGKTLAVGGGSQIVGSGDGKVWLWNLADPARPARIGQSPAVSGNVRLMTFSSDGKTLSAVTNGKVWRWNLADPARPARIGQPLALPADFTAPVAFSPDGKILAVDGRDRKIWRWNLANPARPARLGQPLPAPTDTLMSLAFSPDGKTLVAGTANGNVWRWNLTDPARPARLGHLAGPIGYVDSVAFSPDGKILAAGNEAGNAWLWNLADPAHPVGQRLVSPADAGVTFSPDGKTLVTVGGNTIRLWTFPPNILTGPAGLVGSVAYSPDGKTLAAASDDHKVWLWDLADPARPVRLGQPLAGPANVVRSVAFSPDGKILAAGSGDKPGTPDSDVVAGRVWLWDIADPARPVRLGQPLAGPAGPYISVAFSPDGKILAAAGEDSMVWLWDIADPARPARLGRPLAGPGSFIRSVVFSPDGKILAAANDSGWIRLWNVADLAHPSQPHRSLSVPASTIASVAFSPDGKILAAGTGDRKVWLWNLADPAHPARRAQPLVGPGGAIDSVAFSPNGKTLATVSDDYKVWLWNMTDPAHPARFGQPLTGPFSPAGSIAFSPDGKTLAAGSDDSTVWLWNLDVDTDIQRICATTSNILTYTRWKQYLPQLPYRSACAHPGHYGLLTP